jgi:hypothetical protein
MRFPFRLVCAGLLSLVVAWVALGVAQAQTTVTVSVAWTAPTTRVDGSALPSTEIAGYNVVSVVNGTTQPQVAVGAVTSTTLTVGNGTVCVRLQTRDTDGQVSDWTADVCKKAKPGRPTSVRLP